MDNAGSGIECYVVAEINRRQAIVERMPKGDFFKRCALAGGHRGAGKLVTRKTYVLKVTGENQQPLLGIHEVVVDLRVYVQRLVCRQRPRRGGPDNGESGLIGQLGQAESHGQFFGLGKFETNVDRDVCPVFILDLGFSERRAAIEAPVDRLEAAKDVALFKQHAERADLVGFVARGHRQVRTLPIAQHTEALKIFLLPLDLFGRIGTA